MPKTRITGPRPGPFALVAALCLAFAVHAVAEAQAIQVTAADPSSAPQGTINLDIEIRGSGFDSSAVAQFLAAGTSDPGGVRVNATTFRGPKRLIANIDVAIDAQVGDFDILVQQRGGRTGKGTELFSVLQRDRPAPFTEEADLSFENRSGDAVQGTAPVYRIELVDGHPMSELGLAWIDFANPVPGTGAGDSSAACGTEHFVNAFESIEVTLASSVLTVSGEGNVTPLPDGLFGMVEDQQAQASLKLTWWAMDGVSIPLWQRLVTERGHRPLYWNEQWSLELDGAFDSTLVTVRRLLDWECAERALSSPCWSYDVPPTASARLVCVPPGKGGLDHKAHVVHSLYSLPTAFQIETLDP